jgi:predicted DNA-binding transcriptional regulator
MSKDQFIGSALLLASIIIIVIYVWLVFFPPLHGADIFILKLTGAVAVTGVFAILAWIGYTLATTPPPKPIEEIEKEIEKEIKESEGEAGKPKSES